MKTEIKKSSTRARLFKYHPERFFILRSYPEWESLALAKHERVQIDRYAAIRSIGEEILDEHERTDGSLNDEERVEFDFQRLVDAIEESAGGQSSAIEFAIQRWMARGEQIFDLSSIAALYLDAEASEVPLQTLRLPFDAFYIYWGAHLEIESPTPGRFVEGCYFTRSNIPGEEGMTFNITFTSSHPFNDPWDERSLLANVAIDCEGVSDLIAHAESENTTISDVEKILSEENAYEEGQRIRWAPVIHQALNMAANCMCYLAWDKAEIRAEYPPEAPAKLVQQTRSLRPTEQRRAASKLESLGFRMVRIGGEKLAESIGLASGTKTVPPHWRRGHWRHQRHGKGRESVKLIWIQAAIINQDHGSPELGHIYRP